MSFFNGQLIAALLLISTFTALGGLFIALKKPSWYTTARQEQWIAFSTGILLGVAFFEFLPHAMETSPSRAPLFILIGLLFILFVETFIASKITFFEGRHCNHDHAQDHEHKQNPSQEHQHHLISHQAACSAVGCLIVCAFFDGIEITTAFSLGPQKGWATSLALLFHILPDGILAANIALAGGMSRHQALASSCITGLSLMAGSASTLLLSTLLEGRGGHAFILPFATGILLYVALIHLLPVGMKHPRGLWWLCGGALFFCYKLF